MLHVQCAFPCPVWPCTLQLSSLHCTPQPFASRLCLGVPLSLNLKHSLQVMEKDSNRQARLEADAKRKRDKRRQDPKSAESERQLHRTAQRLACERDAPQAEAHRQRDRSRKDHQRQQVTPQAEAHRQRNRSRKDHQRQLDAPQAEAHRQRDRSRKHHQRQQDAPQAQAHRRQDRGRKDDERQHDAPQAEAHRLRDRQRQARTRQHDKCPNHPYSPALTRPCEHCGSVLLAAEAESSGSPARITPCCASGKVRCRLHHLQVPCSTACMLGLATRGANCLMLIWSAAQVQLAVPPLPTAVAHVFDDPLFPAAARTINHRCNYVTTYVSPQQGRAFHEPARPPCLLNLHGTVYHWLRSREGAAGSNAVVDSNLAMEQWWTTPDSHEPDSATDRLVRSFRSALLNCNLVTKELVRACELSNRDPSKHIALRFQHGDAGPDVSAVYHTGSADRMPPHLQLCKWAAGSERPRCQPLRHGCHGCHRMPWIRPI
jgi:hypothetical protein